MPYDNRYGFLPLCLGANRRPSAGEIMTTDMQKIIPVLARVFVSSAWYDTENARSKLYCKAREVVIGDRVEKIAQEEIDQSGQSTIGGK